MIAEHPIGGQDVGKPREVTKIIHPRATVNKIPGDDDDLRSRFQDEINRPLEHPSGGARRPSMEIAQVGNSEPVKFWRQPMQ